MTVRRRLCLALLAVLAGTAGADAPRSSRCCEVTPGWTVGADFGALWVTTDEFVEALPGYAAEHLSRLRWQALAGVAGVRVSYRSGERMRMNGGVWYVEDAGGGELVNLDYLDATSEAVTHRSVSPADLRGAGWELSIDVALVEERRGEMFVHAFARVGYRGAYHAWAARGGEHEYPGRQGRFAEDEELIRYLVLHQVFDVGAFVEVGQAREGFYGRLGGAVSVLSLVDDRDTHLLSDTQYYNTYRGGWHVRPEVAVGVGFGGGALEVFYEPAWQFSFAETGTQIKTPSGVYVPAENPNFRMTLHRIGIRVAWP